MTRRLLAAAAALVLVWAPAEGAFNVLVRITSDTVLLGYVQRGAVKGPFEITT